MQRPIRIALTKGRLEKDTVGMFEQLGLDCTAVREKGRKLILPVGDGSIEVVLAKANDVITYVEHGVCDLGVVGKDTILEMQGKFYELLDLGFGRCKFALAVKKGTDFYSGYGVKTATLFYQLDVMIKIADLATGRIVFSGVFTGEDRELRLEGTQIVDNDRFERLMKSAVFKAAQAIDQKFDNKEKK